MSHNDSIKQNRKQTINKLKWIVVLSIAVVMASMTMLDKVYLLS